MQRLQLLHETPQKKTGTLAKQFAAAALISLVTLFVNTAYATPTSEYVTGVRDSNLNEKLRELDRQTQIIKERSLDVFHSQAVLMQAFDQSSDDNKLRVFFSSTTGTFPIDYESIAITVGDNPPQTFDLSGHQSAALNGNQRLTHALRVDEFAYDPGAETKITVQLNAGYQLGVKRWDVDNQINYNLSASEVGGIRHLEINFVSNEDAELGVRAWEVTDPRQLAALYNNEAKQLTEAGRRPAAITNLQIAIEQGWLNGDIDKAELQLAEAVHGYGLHYLSSALYQKLVDRPNPVRIPKSNWQQLAKMQFNTGYFGLTGLVEYSLSRIRDDRASDEELGEKRLLLAQLYIAQQRYSDAIKMLEDWDGAKELEPFARYNLGISLINTGASERGEAILDNVGQIRGSADDIATLRDLANLSLAYYFLDKEQAGTALPLLKRIRNEGLYSNKALLALGWAELGESGKVHKNSELIKAGCENQAAHILADLGGAGTAANSRCVKATAFKREKTASSKKGKLERALAPWLQVRKRNAIDPAVQETLLAIPFALHRLKKYDLAIQHYRYALKVYDSEIKRNQQALTAVSRGQLLNRKTSIDLADLPNWQLHDLNHAEGVDLRLLYMLAARHEFYQGLQNYRGLIKLAEQLQQQKQTIKDTRNQWYNNGGGSYFTGLETPQDASQGKRGIKWSGAKEIYSEDSVYQISNKLEQRISKVAKRAESAAEQHKLFLEAQATADINARIDRLIVYSARARLAMARIYDLLTAKEQAPEDHSPAKPTAKQQDLNDDHQGGRGAE